jgi:hypothetical protein
MKKYLMIGVAALAFAVTLTSCSKAGDLYDESRVEQQKEATVNEKYAAAFEKAFGKVGPNVDWGFSSKSSSKRSFTRAEGDRVNYASNKGNMQPSISFPDDLGADDFTIPEGTQPMPNYQGGAGPYYIDETTEQVWSWSSQCVIYVKGNVDLTDKKFELNINTKIYLTKNSSLKLGSYAAEGLNVSFYIAKDATLEVPGHIKVQTYPVYNHGTIKVGSYETTSGSILYNVGKFETEGSVKLDSPNDRIVNDGTIKCASITIETGAIQNNYEWTVTGTTKVESPNSGWVNNGKWKTAYYAYIGGSVNVINNCFLWVTEDFEMNISSDTTEGEKAFKMDSGCGVLTKNFYGGRDSSTGAISGPFKIVMGQNSVFKVEETAVLESGRSNIEGTANYEFGFFGPSSGEYAVFQAKNIVRESSIANTWGAVTYGGNLYVSAETHFAQGNDGTDAHKFIIEQDGFTIADNIYAAGYKSGKPSITISETPCNPGFVGGNPLYRVIAEDLSASDAGDFDFNDVVFDVVEAKDGKTTLKLICAGGTLPLRVMGVEVHDLFGDTTPELDRHPMYNTGAGPTVDPVTFEINGTFTKPEDIKNITIEVYKDNAWMELTATRGKAACKILVDDTFTPVPERKNIADKNGNFTDYVQGKFVDDFWWK